MSLHQDLPPSPTTSQGHGLLKLAAREFRHFATKLRPLYGALDYIDDIGNADALRAAAKIRRQLDLFEPSVTMIGQIKSGKTTLVNAMVGLPDLLPADVNPWTSVVTSLHLSPNAMTPPTKARFRFFDDHEWDHLVKGGGRIGELAGRAGAEDELNKILQQAEAVRQKAKERLGRKFELLLGQEKSYGYFDKALIESFVCAGDADDSPQGLAKSRGYFADITRSADLFMQQAAFPTRLCIRDTPGVNDTFMVREQITIKAIRDSRICVVVLSAHQALSSSDLAMIRLISNVKSSDVIIYVNRIDELGNPGKDVPMIRDSIRRTLKDHKGPEDAEVIFGSAMWAKRAVDGAVADLPKDSLNALYNWAEVCPITRADGSDPCELLWELSGLPALYDAIARRVDDGEGREMAERAGTSVSNLLKRIRVSDNLSTKSQLGVVQLSISPADVHAQLEKIRQSALGQFERKFKAALASFQNRVDRSHESFLGRATEDLAKHLEMYGELEPWSYDPSGLRILLQSGYKIFGAKAQLAQQDSAQSAVDDLKALFDHALGLEPGLFDPSVPHASFVPPPVSIGQSIALDLRGNWWKGWWNRRQSYLSQAQRFQGLVREETQQLVHDLKDDQTSYVYQAMRALLDDFLEEQISNVRSICDGEGSVNLDTVLQIDDLKSRENGITKAMASLEGLWHD